MARLLAQSPKLLKRERALVEASPSRFELALGLFSQTDN